MRSLFLVVAIATITTVAHSQPNKKIDCDDNCVHQKLPFLFCDMNTGSKVTKCTDNPSTEPNLRPLKKRLPPSCQNYDPTNLTIIQPGYSFVTIDGEDTTVIFAADNVAGHGFTAAIDWWLESGCPPQTDGDDCCLNVRWARDRLDLYEFSAQPASVLALLHNHIPPSAGAPDCKVDCNQTWIVLNQTPQFTALDANNFPRRFFYNIEEPGDNGKLSDDDRFEYYHLPSVILHEVGHWYGIGHIGEPDSYGQICGETRGISVMSGGNNGNGLYPGEERTLHDHEDDLCAFRKLYCCAETSVDVKDVVEEISTYGFTVSPNPLYSGHLTVTVGEQLYTHTKTVRLVDMYGNTIAETSIPIGMVQCTLTTDLVADGAYMVVVSSDRLKGSIGKKVIIQK